MCVCVSVSTIELEENNKLPFLDVFIIKKDNGRIGHIMYRKKTHRDRYLNVGSLYHPTQLTSVAKTLTKNWKD